MALPMEPSSPLQAALLLESADADVESLKVNGRPLTRRSGAVLLLLLTLGAVALVVLLSTDSSSRAQLLARWGALYSTPHSSSSAVPPSPLPDPFTFTDGSRVTTKAQWRRRRAEIASMLERLELGPLVPRPSHVTGSVTPTTISVTAGVNATRSITFQARVLLPPTPSPGRQGPWPALIGLGSISLNQSRILELGVAVILLNNSDIAQQDGPQSRGRGQFYALYGAQHPAGAMMAWTWAVGRLLDVLEESGQKYFDLSRVGVTGCSRNGKGALVVAAFEERIALSIPQESGSGGAASWRMSDWQNDRDTPPGARQVVQTLGEIVGENVWFTESFARFGNASATLPYDHHMLMGMVAPRALLVYENPSTVWGGNQSCWGDSLAGHSVYEALGVPDRMGISQLGGYAHCNYPASQVPAVEAFLRRFLLGHAVNTSIIRTDATTYSFNRTVWINWTTPTLT